jgi:ketosteroid isomerase-like protein
VARPDYYGNPAGLSEEIEVVKAVYDAFARRDRDGMAALLSEDCELHLEGTARLAGRASPYRGHDGLRDYFDDVERLWEELVLHADDFRAVPGSVIVMGHITGRRQGLDLRRSSVWTWKVAHGRATSVKAADLGDVT